MNPALYKHISHPLPTRSSARMNIGLYHNTMGLIFLLQQILWISFCFSVKTIIFVRLFPYRTVFVLFEVQFDKRKHSAVRVKLHRLLYFIRAVRFAHPAAAITSGWDDKCYTVHTTAGFPAKRIKRIGETLTMIGSVASCVGYSFSL